MAVIHAALVDETVCGANKRDVGLPSAMLDRHVRGALHIAKRIGTGTGLIDGPTAHDTAVATTLPVPNVEERGS